MANFTITNNKTIHNNCDNGQGKCCGYCQYLSKREGQWEACSESCIADKQKLGNFSCYQCKHKQHWVKK